jgi:hypothetical protein
MKRCLELSSCSLLTALLGAPPSSAVPSGISNQSAGLGSCVTTPSETLLPPNVLGPMTGKSPAWIVDGNAGGWAGADAPVKTLWIFWRESATSVRIRGHEVNGSGKLMFSRGMGQAISDELTFTDARKMSVIPGGATPEIMKSHVFMPSYVFYPTRGCWQFDIGIGGNDYHIVILVK